MFVETKETLFEELEDCITIMNQEDFWQNPVRGMKTYVKDKEGNIIKPAVTREEANKDIKNRRGSQVVEAILRRYKKTTLYELKKHQLSDVVDAIHESVIKGHV